MEIEISIDIDNPPPAAGTARGTQTQRSPPEKRSRTFVPLLTIIMVILVY